MSAPLRIVRPESSKGLRGPTSSLEENVKHYLSSLLKMIPAEVVSLYVMGNAAIPDKQIIWQVIWSLVCLVGVIVVKALGTSDRDKGVSPDWIHVTISSIAFIIWVYISGGIFTSIGLYVPFVGQLLVFAYTFFVPVLYKGQFDS